MRLVSDKAALEAQFQRLVNMTSAQIHVWARDPRAKYASFEATRRRLPRLATLRAKPPSTWTATDRAFAQRVVNFITRMDGMRRVHGCTTKINVALRNWGRRSCGAVRSRRA